MRTSVFVPVLLACTGFLLPGFAQASTIHANASVDWSEFSVIAIDIGLGTPIITWDVQDTTVSMQVFAQSGASTGSTSQIGTINDWFTSLDAAQSLLGSGASAVAGTTNLSAQSSSGSGFSSTSASVSRGGSFSVSGTGLLVFSLPYELSSSAIIDADAPFGDYGSVSGQISISASSFSFGQDSNTIENVFVNSFASFPGDIQSFAVSGILLAALSVHDGGFGFFAISASTNTNGFLSHGGASAIPAPAAVWLMASALLGLGSLRKRF